MPRGDAPRPCLGAGKTSLIKAIANMTGRHIISVSLEAIHTKRQLKHKNVVRVAVAAFLFVTGRPMAPVSCTPTKQKACSRCAETKSADEYHVDKKMTTGLKSWCKSCCRDYEARRDQKARYQLQKVDPETMARCRDRQRARSKKPLIKRQKADYRRQRYATDPQFRMRCVLSTRLATAVRRRHNAKVASVMELVGCDWPTFKARFDGMFRDNMAWDNHGQVWHVDHIRPLAAFDLSDPEQQRLATHYTNLQPLFGEENLAKGSLLPDGSRACQMNQFNHVTKGAAEN